jgi:hypothetical protein
MPEREAAETGSQQQPTLDHATLALTEQQDRIVAAVREWTVEVETGVSWSHLTMPADSKQSPATPFAEVLRRAARQLREHRLDEYDIVESVCVDCSEPWPCTASRDAAALRALAEREAELQRLIEEARLLMAEPRTLTLNRLEVATADIARRLAALSTGYVPKEGA